MAISKSMAYNNAAYVAVLPVLLGNATGANSTSRFAIFTTILHSIVTGKQIGRAHV